MLVNSNKLFEIALKEGYAIPAYNIHNLEWIKSILEACNDDKSPVILEVTPSSIQYMGGYKIVINMVKTMLEELNIKIPVVLHLDHAKDFLSCKEAIDSGFTSVMIDVSDFNYEDGVEITNKVVNYANRYNVSVEAEFKSIDKVDTQFKLNYTSSDECYDFICLTNVDSLAPAVGNVHGLYNGDINIDFELLGSICKTVKIPLVLHGASFLDENKLKTAIFCGVAKVNINTDLMCSWTNAIREYLKNNENIYDLRKIISYGCKAIKKVVHEKNNILGSKNRAI